MNKLRSRLNAGCVLLLTSGVVLSLAFNSIDSTIDWITEELATLEVSPIMLAALEAVALAILGPIVLAALVHIFSKGLYRTVAQIFSFWWAGLKSGIVCLLLFLPLLIIQQAMHVTPAPPFRGLFAVFMVLLCISAPFWSLLLIRRLPKALLSGTLFERFDPEMFSSDRQA